MHIFFEAYCKPYMIIYRANTCLYVILLQLKPVEFLLGSTSKLGEIIVLGMLTQLKEVSWGELS